MNRSLVGALASLLLASCGARGAAGVTGPDAATPDDAAPDAAPVDRPAAPDAPPSDAPSDADVADVPVATDAPAVDRPDVMDVPSPIDRPDVVDVPSPIDRPDVVDVPVDVGLVCRAGYFDCNGRADDGCETEGPCAPAAGLVAWYPLDGTGVDLGPAAAHGALTAATPTADRFGRAGRALRFAAASRSTMSAPDNPRMPVGAAARSVSVWFRARVGADPWPYRTMVYLGSAGTARRFALATLDDRALFTAENADAPGDTPVRDDRWHHLAATYDGASVTLYVDGRAEASERLPLATVGRSLLLGHNPVFNAEDFTGDLDELRVYDRALRADEVGVLLREGTATCVPDTARCATDSVWEACDSSRRLTTASCGALLGCRGGACVPRAPIAGLVAYYPFSGGAARDRSPGGVSDGVVSATAATSDRFRRSGEALRFDPSSASSVLMPANPRLPLGAAPRTLSVWMRTTRPVGGPDYRSAACWGSPTPGQRFGISNNLDVTLFTGEGGAADLPSAVRVTDDRWHHVLATYDGATVALWVDGVRAAVGARSLSTLGSVLVVGRTPLGHPGTDYFPGDLDDVRVYDRALGEAEIDAVFRDGGWSGP